jgi:pimeloyl-ACP methyl ester carboxylesterase
MTTARAGGPDPAVAHLGGGFAEGTVTLDGVTLHYVRGGSGPALVLLHGFPQDWYEWRLLMPRLAQRYSVIAVDLRGTGGSSAPPDGYAAADLAADVHGLLGDLGVERAHVVGHDIGGWVAYAYARSFPEATRTVLVMETLVPGVEPFQDLDIDVPLWHGEFHMVPGLAEALVSGRQSIYFRYFFDVGTSGDDVIGDSEVERYADAYGDREHLTAAFEVYRAIPANAAFNAGHTEPVAAPLLLVGGEHVFGQVMPALAENLRAHHGWASVTVQVIEGGRHYLPEEYPDQVAALIEGHAVGD